MLFCQFGEIEIDLQKSTDCRHGLKHRKHADGKQQCSNREYRVSVHHPCHHDRYLLKDRLSVSVYRIIHVHKEDVYPTNGGFLNDEVLKYIISRLMSYAKDASEALKENRKDVFYQGKDLAYTEMKDVIENELRAFGKEPRDYGLCEE